MFARNIYKTKRNNKNCRKLPRQLPNINSPAKHQISIVMNESTIYNNEDK